MSLIVLEGLDGSGKGTQAQLLYEALSARYGRVRKLHFQITVPLPLPW